MHNISNNQSVLLVNPISSGKNLKKILKEKGYGIIIVYTLSEEILQSDAFGVDVKLLKKEYPIVIFKDTLKKVQNIDFRNKHNIIGVVPASESGVIFAAKLSKIYALTGNAEIDIIKCRDKFSMRKTLSESNLEHPKYARIHNDDDLINFNDSAIKYPAILKPPSSSGTSQVFICNKKDDILKNAKEILNDPNIFGDRNSYILIEEFMEGEEHAVNGFVKNNNVIITDIWRYIKDDGCLSKNVLLLESINNRKFSSAIEYVKKCVKSLGIKRGMFHGEIILNTEKNEPKPMLVELAARMSGLSMIEIIKKVSNFNPYDIHLSAFIDSYKYSIPHDIYLHSNGAIVCVPIKSHGIVDSIVGVDDIKSLKSYDSHSTFIKKGNQVSNTKSLFNLMMTINLINKNRSQLLYDIDRAKNTVKLITK